MAFCPRRLRLARIRLGLRGRELAERAGVHLQTISNWETGRTDPGQEDIAALATATGFPVEWFAKEPLEMPAEGAVSFRARTTISAGKRNAALAAGAMATELADWIEARFELPPVRLPDLSARPMPPELVAEAVRKQWGLGDQPIGNVIHLLESLGVLVFSLAQDTRKLDAFSFWHRGRPIVMLNTMKSAERSRMDAAHELLHLLCHRDRTDKEEEEQANQFAGAFLMPRGDVLRHGTRLASIAQLATDKRRWAVSLAAYVYRLQEIGVLSAWQYRTLFVHMSQSGATKVEINPLPEREMSALLPQVFADRRPAAVARELGWSRRHLEELIFGMGAALLAVDGGRPLTGEKTSATQRPPAIQIVKGEGKK